MLVGDENDLPGRSGDGKGAHQLFLCLVELIDGKFGNEGNAFTAFYHTHECLHAAQMISDLAGLRRLHLADADSLVAEAMSLVQHPKLFVAEIGGADNLIIEQFAFARDVRIELFVE